MAKRKLTRPLYAVGARQIRQRAPTARLWIEHAVFLRKTAGSVGVRAAENDKAINGRQIVHAVIGVCTKPTAIGSFAFRASSAY